MMRQFRDFLLRGNVVDLAVAVIVGAAFGAVVTALVRDIVTPLIAAIGGQPDFSALDFTVNGSRFAYGDFLNAVIAFLVVGAVVFFLVVKPVDALMARRRAGLEPEAQAVSEDVALLAEIRDLLRAQQRP
jgi:large conductance mechanosensitive channel